MTLKRYTLAVTSPEHWDDIHSALTLDSNRDGIPDRKITCVDEKSHSATRGTYELTEEEAAEIARHPYVKWIELSLKDNRDNFPRPQLVQPQRWDSDVKIYRDLNSPNNPPASSPTSTEENRTNWAVPRISGIGSNGDFWPNVTGSIAPKTGNVNYLYDGRNVDIVIHDSGVLQSHPEFLNDNGTSRVRDIVLDFPYFLDPGWFQTNGFTFTLEDGSTGITTASAESWWEDNNARSTEFNTLPEVVIPSGYTRYGSVGVGTAGASSLTSGHGTACASLAAGKNFGLAFKANIWNMPGIGDNVNMDIETNYDLIKFFHQYKPVNSETGRRNPTVVNGSWGYQAAVNSGSTVNYRFLGVTSSITMPVAGGDPSGVEDMIFGFNNQVLFAYRSWSSSSRSSATNDAGDEMMDAGVIYVSAAGNNNQYIGVGLTDPYRLNGIQDAYFGVNDTRPEFGGQRTPCSHRDWMNPQGIGADLTTGYHPVINVGAMDDFVESNYKERKASYSNSGPGVDIYAPADETLAAGLISGSYADYQRYDNPSHYDCFFNGTSAAAPVVTGLVALYLQRNPGATSADVRSWLLNDYGQGVGVGTTAAGGTVVAGGSTQTGTDLFFDQYPSAIYGQDDSQWWTGSFNQRTADGSGNIQVTYLDVNAGILTEAGGINEPSIESPINNDVGVNTEGLVVRSTTYSAIGGTTVSGTLRSVEMQLSRQADFSSIDWESDPLQTSLEQTVDVTLLGFTTYYARVRHTSFDDGTAFTSYTSPYSVGIVSFATLGNAPGVAAPFVLAPTNGVTTQQRFGIELRSSVFVAIDGVAVSGTLKAVEFQVAEDIGFSNIVFTSVGQNNTSLSQVISEGLNSSHTFYVRVRHLSNADGSSGVAHTSPWSTVTNFTTPAAAIAEVGRLASIKTTLTNGVVEPVLLYEADNLLEVSIGVANQNDFRSTFSIGISSTPGFKQSDYITYGIPLDRGGTRLIEKVGVKPGDKIFVASFDPNISFIAFATRKFDKLSADSALVHGRKRSGTLSYNPPFQINTNLEFFTAQEDSLVTVHATNQNSDSTVGMSVGLSSGGVAEFTESDYLVYGLRLAPLQDVQIDNLALAKGQSLIVRGSRPNLTFVAHSVPQDPGPSGIGTNLNVVTTGNITAGAFFGDGSGITGVVGTGAGVEVRDNDTPVGTASTINFGENLTVSQISAGIVTITGSDTVAVAQTANSLAPGVSIERATYADYATIAGLATQATSAATASLADNATTAATANAIAPTATITSNNDITAPRFIGDGSQLTNIVAAGSGVIVKDSGSLVGTAGTVDFDAGLDVSAVSAGIVTVTINEAPRATLAGIASEAIVAGIATYATLAGLASQANNALFASSASFSTLTGAADTAKNLYTESERPFKPLPVTIGTKTTDHRYYGIGSDRSVNVQGYESPYLRFEVGMTYRFENAAQQSNYPIRFYYAPDGSAVGFGTTTPITYGDNVTETGTYTEILVTDQTPQLLYYGAGIGTTMGNMGNSIQVFNYDFHKVNRVGEFKNLSGLKTCTYTQMFEGRATSWYMNSNLGVGNSDYTPGDRSHNISSLVQTSTGVYTVNFADPMNDTDYAVIGIGSGINAFPGGIVELRISDRTVNGFTMRVYNSIPALEDLGELSIVTYGGQDGERTYI